MNIKISKNQLDELKLHLSPLLKKALIGKPIKPVTKFMQGLVPIGEGIIDESPDMVAAKNAKYDDDDAIGFGFLDGKAWIGYNDSLPIENFDKKILEFINRKPEFGTNIKTIKGWLKMHGGFKYFYEILGEECYVDRKTGKYNGRIWLNRNIISFWEYPPKEELFRLLRLLKNEIKRIYGIDVDFNNYQIEIKTDKGVSDLNWGEIIPIKQYVSSNDASENDLKLVHLLPSDEKKNTPQMKSALNAKYQHIGNKLGSMTQAEYNHYKRYGMGENVIKENPDKINDVDDANLSHWSNDDAISFGFIHDKAYVGYCNGLFFESPNIPQDIKNNIDRHAWKFVEGLSKHSGIGEFYSFLNKDEDNDWHTLRGSFKYSGRLWYEKKLISFWSYPEKNKLMSLLPILSAEINRVYGLKINFNDYRIEIKGGEYQSDLDQNDEDYEPDLDWEYSNTTGNLIPMKNFVGSDSHEIQNIHTLPSDEKKNTPQMKAAMKADSENLANKFNGNTSQAEWNAARNKYRGESKTIKITTNQLNEIKKYLNKDASDCPNIKISPEIFDYINKFNTDEEFLRSGGLPVTMLDRLAFGFADEDIKTLSPNQLHIKWQDDLENVVWEQQRSGLSKIEWAKKINLSEPIDVSYEKNKFYVEDGHHRYYAAHILGKDLNVNIEINMNPTETLSKGLGYDKLCRCIFKQVKNKGVNEGVNEEFVYHASPKPIDKIVSYSEYNKNKSGYYPGMYFFNNKEISKTFYDPSKYKIYKTNVDGLKLYDLKDGDELKQLASKNGVDVNAGSGYREAYWLESQGYDGIKRGQYEVILFKPENLNIEKVDMNIDEDINIPITTGDTITMGKFKNKKTVVKTIDKDSHGMPTINGKQATTFRIPKKIEESKDYVYGNYNGETIEVSNEDYDAIPFVYFNNKVYVGYNPDLGENYKEKGYKDDNNENRWPNFHSDIAGFYSFMGDKSYIPINRGGYEYSGRIWYDRRVVSFYKYPEDKNKMKQIMSLLNAELNKIYGETFDFDNFIVDTTDDGLISMRDYVGSENASDEVINSPHLLSPEQKKNSPQLKAVKNYDNNKLSNEFSGGVSQAEWNAAKNKYRGESVEISGEQLIEATIDDVNLNSFKPKNELNEHFWLNNKIKSIVRKRLLKITDDFIEYLKIDINKIEDILFIGSLANYNWSSYSDVDLHLLIDMSKINKDVELVKEYFDSKKKLWNDEHENLKIFGFPIEIYIQDLKEKNASMGVYSLETNNWIKKPVVINDSEFDKKKIKEKASRLMTEIEDLLALYKAKPTFSKLEIISKKTKTVYDKIKRIRKQGLESEKGELSVGNIVFKVLRRNGYLEKLIDLKIATYDKINTLK